MQNYPWVGLLFCETVSSPSQFAVKHCPNITWRLFSTFVGSKQVHSVPATWLHVSIRTWRTTLWDLCALRAVQLVLQLQHFCESPLTVHNLENSTVYQSSSSTNCRTQEILQNPDKALEYLLLWSCKELRMTAYEFLSIFLANPEGMDPHSGLW